MRHVYLPDGFVEPPMAELDRQIEAREARWREALRRGSYEAPLHRVGDVLVSSAVMVDGARIYPRYRTAIEFAALLGGRLVEIEEAITVLKTGRYEEPTKVTFRTGPNAHRTSASDTAIALHSHALGPLATDLRCNEGKWFLSGARAGRARIFGWRDDALPATKQIAPGVRGWQGANDTAHDDGHTDCSHTFRFAVDAKLPPTPRIPLGMLSLSVGITQLGEREIPGAEHNPQILRYHSVVERGGQVIGQWAPFDRDETEWCMSFASWCLVQAAQALGRPRTVWPHLPRAACWEAWVDAIERGTARPAADVRAGLYQLRPGDLLLSTRGDAPANGGGRDAFALSGAKGHARRVACFDGSGLVVPTLEGNAADAVRDLTYDVRDPGFVGAITYGGWFDGRLDAGDLETAIRAAQAVFAGRSPAPTGSTAGRPPPRSSRP